MIYFLYSILSILLSLWLLWYFYIIVMGLYRAQLNGQLSMSSKILGAPAIVIGVILDWAINFTVATIIFREFPKSKSELVTQRLSRYITETGWKHKYASFVCNHILDVFDPTGTHCK